MRGRGRRDHADMDVDDDDDDHNAASGGDPVAPATYESDTRSSDDADDVSDDDDKVVSSSAAASGWDDDAYRRHLLLPHVISGYLQLSFNIVIISFVMYALASFVSSVHGDIDNKVSEFSGTILNEIAECHNNYRANRCGTTDEVPAMRTTCAMWERCMARDPTTVARTKLSAHTIGEILNGFVEPLSLKAMAFFTLFLFCFIIASNVAFKLGASKPPIANLAFPDGHWGAGATPRIPSSSSQNGYRAIAPAAPELARY
ncbi:Brl1/Brr6 domain-containing protein [Plasmodiophora brassicae]